MMSAIAISRHDAAKRCTTIPDMPVRYVIDKERRVVVSIGWDRVSNAEIRAHRDQLANDPDFNPAFNQLVDGTAVTALDISMDEAKEIASRTIFSPPSRRAFVARNLLILGMARLMETYSRIGKVPEQVKVFNDRAAALQWLGLDTFPDNC
jgi:hypothetical protein